MRRRTTTQKLHEAITNNLLHIVKAEIYYKTSGRTETIDTGTFQESLDFLCESLFMDAVGWHYERDIDTGQYIAECGRKDGGSDVIIMAHFKVNDGVDADDVEQMLVINELER